VLKSLSELSSTAKEEISHALEGSMNEGHFRKGSIPFNQLGKCTSTYGYAGISRMFSGFLRFRAILVPPAGGKKVVSTELVSFTFSYKFSLFNFSGYIQHLRIVNICTCFWKLV